MNERKYCDECVALYPKELDQSNNKEPHICRQTSLRVRHLNEHPRLPRPEWCPLQVNEIKFLEQRIELKDAALRSLARSAKVVMQSLDSGDYIPEFRYKDLEKNILEARKAKDK